MQSVYNCQYTIKKVRKHFDHRNLKVVFRKISDVSFVENTIRQLQVFYDFTLIFPGLSL